MYIPSFYFKNEQVFNITTSMNIEAKLIQKQIEDILTQMYVDTATWGLADWEKLLALKVDKNEAIENRRARVKMRLRGTGTFNKKMIMNLCQSFTNGNVCVQENNSNNSFIIKFIDVKGIPGNIDYLEKAIDEVKPAHLTFSFEYTWLTWDEFEKYNKTWNEWDLSNLTWDEFEKYREVI